MDNNSYTGWTSSGRVKPPTPEETAAHEEGLRRSKEAWAVIQEEERKSRITKATQEYDEQAARVADFQKRFEDALATEPSDLVRWQFQQMFDETQSANERARAMVWIERRSDMAAYLHSVGDGIPFAHSFSEQPEQLTTCTLWALLEKAKAELGTKRRPAEAPAPVKVESAFVQALKRARTEDDLFNIDDAVLTPALNDETDWRDDHVLASYVRLLFDWVLTKNVGQVAGRILSRKRDRARAGGNLTRGE